MTKGPTLYALDPHGNQLFTFSTTTGSTPFDSSPAIGKNGWLYVTDTDGVVYGVHDP